MSEPKLISPMLDNFDMGDPISAHDGVRCCPAMNRDTSSKYIVKIISVPASSAQIDALILSGAFSCKEEAVKYFKTVADDILSEAEALKTLSRIDGFEAFEQWQVESMEDNSGYDIYLLGTYKNSLEKVLRTDAMTQLRALNLGLDLCSALSICRRSGYLYVDLKPENIYLSNDHGFRIGDLGLMKLDSLKYASLPDRYRSRYTAPEIADAFSALNTTIDVYAVGMILYQVYNGGTLPTIDLSGDAPLQAPDYADYEMAEIILKACAPNPADRWQDPVEMGQAIVSYMQRNGAHDTPIVPLPELEVSEPAVEESCPDQDSEVEDSDAEASAVAMQDGENDADQHPESESDADTEDNSAYAEDNEGNLSFIWNDQEDETLPGQQDETLDYEEVSEEVTDMLNQADDLIAHPTPDPVVAPDPIDVPVPPPLPIEPETQEEPAESDTTEADTDLTDESEAICEAETQAADEQESVTDDNSEYMENEEQEKPRSKWLRNALLALIGLIILAGGLLFYKLYYLQDVSSLVLQGAKNYLTVYVTSEAKDADLFVVCSDTYGNKHTKPVVDGAAHFENLAPNTPYTVKVEVDGFHKLTGKVLTEYITPAMTTITQFTAVTGKEDGSAALTLTTDGPGTADWKVSYSAANEPAKEITFSGSMTTINSLTIGKTYTFTLTPVADIYVTGQNEITHTASKLIMAENLQVTSCYNGVLTVQWDKPDGADISSWTVRCYNDKGYNEVVVVEELTASFEGITDADSYTVEVLAAGMSVSQPVDVSANSITLSAFTATEGANNALLLSWSCSNAPDNTQWSVSYSVDGSPVQTINQTDGATCEIPLIPGAQYSITLQAASGSSVLGGQMAYTAKAPENFSSYGADTEHMEFKMCVTPKNKNWDRYDVKKYTTEFTSGQKAAFVVRLRKSYKTSSDKIEVLYVIRNSKGNIVSFSSNVRTWKSMWRNSYGQFEIPSIPDAAGEYSVTVFFNGAFAAQQNFTVK